MKTIIFTKHHNLPQSTEDIFHKNSISITYVCSVPELEEQLNTHKSNLLFLEMADYENEECLQAIRLSRSYSKLKIIFFTDETFSTVETFHTHSDSTGILLRNIALERYLSSEARKEASKKLLTRREQELLRLKAQGYTQVQIADTLAISRRTVNTHFQSIHKKLEVNSSICAVVKAIQIGVISL